MERDQYRRWRDHPIREVLIQAANGTAVRSDELDRPELPKTIRRATEQAIKKVQEEAGNGFGNQARLEATRLSVELVEALPEDHETAAAREARQKGPDAGAIADRIVRGY